MSGDAPQSSSPGRRGSRIALVLAVFVLAGGWAVMRASDDPADSAIREDAMRSDTAIPVADNHESIAEIAIDQTELPEGALPPILGEPRLDRIEYCDERNWGRIDALVREIRSDELIVDEGVWLDAGASTRAGLASWASKCRLDGRALVVRAYGSGHELGAYDATLGYQTFD